MDTNLVHEQGSCACTRIFGMHKILVHAQESWTCTGFLCMHKISVHAQDLCPLNFMNLTDLSVELHSFSYDFHENMCRAKYGPNQSSRPLNMQLLLEIPILIQWTPPNKK